MASEDFLLLTDLIYNQGWAIKEVKHDFGKEIGWSSTVVLSKNGETRVLQSMAEDFVSYAGQLQRTIDAKGQGRLMPISDSRRYWDDIEHLVDLDGGKTRSAMNAILSGSFKFSFNPFDGIKKILQDRIPTNDVDVRGVKSNFFETFSQVLLEGRNLLKLRENPEKTNPLFASYASAYEKVLRRGFFGQADRSNIIDAYKKYKTAIQIDHADLVRRVNEQEKYTEFLRQLLAAKGSVDVQNGARAVIDAYWRLCELCRQMLYVAYVAMAFAAGKAVGPDQPRFEDLVEYLSDNPDTSKLVECVEPALRNSEAHCASSVIMEGGSPLVIAYDSRGDPSRELKRFTLPDIVGKLNCLQKSLVIALCLTLEMFEYAFLLLVLNSYEFKMLLVTLDQY
jgi:hypothetical protein